MINRFAPTRCLQPTGLDFVREMTAATWVPMECRSGIGDYRQSSAPAAWSAMQVVVMDIMPICVRCTPELISQADPDMLKMVLVCGGNSCVVAQEDGLARLLCRRASSLAYDNRGAPTRWRVGSADTGRRR